MNRKSLGIYIHIPFCVRKCLYCDFVSGPASIQMQNNYVNQILKEIDIRAKRMNPFIEIGNVLDLQAGGINSSQVAEYLVDTVFIGGGTPSVIEGDWIKEVLCKLKEIFDFTDDCECSIEVNPGTVDYDKLIKYREAGINRLSIGLQSGNNNELKALGRIHDYETFLDTYKLARKAGFENINVDLMSSVPEQTEDSFEHSLRRVAELNPEHISVYSLIVEEGTPFYDMELKLPDEETERNIYYATKRILQEYGYVQYEISNYAKPGRECRHNVRYWQCQEYLGFGAAAASYVNGVRWKNTENVNAYLKIMQNVTADTLMEDSHFYSEKENLSAEEMCGEFMFMGLRMNAGVSEEEFERRFGCTMDEKYGDVIAEHIQNGLLVKDGLCITLTEKGRDVCNFVMADFLL